MRWRTLAVVALVVGGAPGALARAEEGDRAKAVREAFRPLRIPPAAKLEKDLLPLLPAGIVIEAKPFHDLVGRLGGPLEEALGRREAALAALTAPVTTPEADAVRAGWRAVDAECADLLERVAAVEAKYAEVYSLEWDAASEKDRQTRKSAAVLIPLYRRLLAREAALAPRAAQALAGLEGDAGRAYLAGAAASDPAPGLRAAAIEALARIGGADALAVVSRAASADPESPVRLRALGALCAWKVAEAKDAFLAALDDPAWEVRALSVAICARGKILDAVFPLIRRLSKEDGRLRRDIDEALFALVGVRMQGDADQWGAWWRSNEAEMAAKAKARAESGAYASPLGDPAGWEEAPAADGDGDAKGATSDFYGIPTWSRHVVYVVDISKSMEEPGEARPAPRTGAKDAYPAPRGNRKIDVAKWQLHRAIEALPADATFGILVYSESYRAWMPAMGEATPKNRQRAHEFVDGLRVNGTTNLCDAMDRALEIAGAGLALVRGKAPRTSLAADTIYLLSDGDPNRGRLTDFPALLADLSGRARANRIVVHAIGIGEAAGSTFLADLARRTGGRYVGFR